MSYASPKVYVGKGGGGDGENGGGCGCGDGGDGGGGGGDGGGTGGLGDGGDAHAQKRMLPEPTVALHQLESSFGCSWPLPRFWQ